MAIVPVSGQLSLKALASAVGAKRAVMGDPKAVEKSTGYVLGGISPIGQRKALPTILDISALDHSTVFVSGGRRGLDLELKPDDLISATRAGRLRYRRDTCGLPGEGGVEEHHQQAENMPSNSTPEAPTVKGSSKPSGIGRSVLPASHHPTTRATAAHMAAPTMTPRT